MYVAQTTQRDTGNFGLQEIVRSGAALKSAFFIVLKIFKSQMVSPEEGRRLLPKCTLSVFMKMEKVLLKAAHFILRISCLRKSVSLSFFIRHPSCALSNSKNV